MSAAARRRALALALLAACAAAGMAFGASVEYQTSIAPWMAAVGLAAVAALTAWLGAREGFLMGSRATRRLRAVPFMLAFGLGVALLSSTSPLGGQAIVHGSEVEPLGSRSTSAVLAADVPGYVLAPGRVRAFGEPFEAPAGATRAELRVDGADGGLRVGLQRWNATAAAWSDLDVLGGGPSEVRDPALGGARLRLVVEGDRSLEDRTVEAELAFARDVAVVCVTPQDGPTACRRE